MDDEDQFLSRASPVTLDAALASVKRLDAVMREFANGDRKALGSINLSDMANVFAFIRQQKDPS